MEPSPHAMSDLFGPQERSFLTGHAPVQPFLTEGGGSLSGPQAPGDAVYPERCLLTGPGIPDVDYNVEHPSSPPSAAPPAPPTSPVLTAPYGLEEMALNEWVNDDRDMFSHL